MEILQCLDGIVDMVKMQRKEWHIGRNIWSLLRENLCRAQLLFCRIYIYIYIYIYLVSIWVGKGEIIFWCTVFTLLIHLVWAIAFACFSPLPSGRHLLDLRGFCLSIYKYKLLCNLAVHTKILTGCIPGIDGCRWHSFPLFSHPVFVYFTS